MDPEQQKRIVEAVVLASPEPIPPARIAELIPRCNPSQVRALVKQLNDEYAEQRHAFEIWEVAGGFQLRSLPEFAPYLRQLQKTRALRLSQAALETLAIVAYRQPVTRAEVEHVRGVDAGAVLRSLLERDLVRIAGHREVPGRPIVYATSRRFLEIFGLAKLGDLPALREIADLPSDGEEDADATPLAAAEPEPGSASESDSQSDSESESESESESGSEPGPELEARAEGEAPRHAPPPPTP